MRPPIQLFDGHNDSLLRLASGPDPMGAFGDCGDNGHLDLAKARQGGFAGGLFACFVRPDGDPDAGFALTEDGYTVTMPDPPCHAHARRRTDAMIAVAHRLAGQFSAAVMLCRSVSDITRSLNDGRLALMLHLEGAEAVGEDLGDLEHFYDLGVRSIGPVWSRQNCFGTGVPFKYPGGPDIGSGLTPAGFDLVRACNALGVMLDVSHLNSAGFWDVERTSRAPIVATHSNAHALCPVPRNLTDDQIKAIGDSGGLVGVSLSVSELRPDGHNSPATPLSDVLHHIDHLLGLLGPDAVALGSDFDGAVMPRAIGDAAGLQNLVSTMFDHGYDEGFVIKFCHGNWLRVLETCCG